MPDSQLGQCLVDSIPAVSLEFLAMAVTAQPPQNHWAQQLEVACQAEQLLLFSNSNGAGSTQ